MLTNAVLRLTDWIASLLSEMDSIALTLDRANSGDLYQQSLAEAKNLLAQPQQLASAQVLKSLNNSPTGSYLAFIKQRSLEAKDAINAMPWNAQDDAFFSQLALESIAQQKSIEASDTLSFDAYVAKMLGAV